MRDINRIEPFCQELLKVWKNNPDMRFSQLIVNLMGGYGSDMYYVEDEDFINILKEFYNDKD